MPTRVVMSILMAAGLAVAGCSGDDAGPTTKRTERPLPGQLAAARLVSSSDCADLLSGLRDATAAQVGPYGLGGSVRLAQPLTGAPGDVSDGGQLPAAPPGAEAGAEAGAKAGATTDHSATNVQEAGVDEPDMVKTDGRRIVAMARGRLYVVDAAAHRVTGTLDMRGAGGVIEDDLLLSGNRVLVVERLGMGRPIPFREGEITDVPPRSVTGSRLTLVDISAAPRVVSRLTADGFYVDARQVGSVARVVVRSVPRIDFPLPTAGDQTSPADRTRANQRIVRKAPLSSWQPTFQITGNGRPRTQRVPCAQISHPPAYTGTSLLSVLTVDLNGDLGATDPVSVVAGGQSVYATASSLYVTNTGGEVSPVQQDQTRRGQLTQQTDIYKFDIRGSGRPRYVASGAVPGGLLNQYSLSEYGGDLRVATTVNPIVPPRPLSPTAPTVSPEGPRSSVHVLAQRGDRLAAIGRLDGLGAGERIYAVRFLGPTGYVVTFRQVDPLYVLDLRDPRRPRTAGQLKINGYSAYLHPAGDGLLIGVGQDATSQGQTTGTQVSLFDVRDPAKPRRLSQYKVESGNSEVEFDPHAFLYRPDTGLTVLPVQRFVAARPPATGLAGQALVLSVRDQQVRRLGMVDQSGREENRPSNNPAIRRSLTIGTTLWTMSDGGLRATDAATLAQQAWVAFP
jgi:beta propeller domain-containing protein